MRKVFMAGFLSLEMISSSHLDEEHASHLKRAHNLQSCLCKNLGGGIPGHFFLGPRGVFLSRACSLSSSFFFNPAFCQCSVGFTTNFCLLVGRFIGCSCP